jgi:hypothetical protein
LANISYRLGRKTPPEEIQESIKTQPKIREVFGRFKDHLFSNWVDLEKDHPVLGASLDMDSDAERFVGSGPYSVTRWANDMLTRRYREPFVVPEKV